MKQTALLWLLSSSLVFGQSVAGWKQLDVSGQLHRLGGRAGQEPFALVFLGSECPISLRSLPGLAELARQGAAEGVVCYGVLSDPLLSRTQAADFQREYSVDFPLLFDASGDLARQLQPSHVPEAFVFAGEVLVYRGRIDDSFAAPGKPRAVARHHELADAIAALAAGKLPQVARSEPVGCIFESWNPALTAPPSYTRDVAPILAAHCVDCHRDGAAAPFALDSYEDAARRARMLALLAQDGSMPPWKPEPGYGHFLDARGLRNEEIERLSAWALAGAPRGPQEDTPPARSFPVGWTFGAPDVVIEMPEAFAIPADGEDVYRAFVIPSELGARDVVGFEFRPGAPGAVHHALFFLDTSGVARKRDQADPEPGYAAFGGVGFVPAGSLGGYAPGAAPVMLPEGLARQLPEGADIVLQIHYHPSGKAESDRSQLALYFADEPVERHLRGLIVGTRDIDIPAGEADYRRSVELELPVDVQLIGVTPHMHYLGREMSVEAELPDGSLVPLIRVGAWDFRWQGQYLYAEEISLPAGTRLRLEARYDNSEDNPDNPHYPPERVRQGEQTSDEMCLCFFQVTTATPADYQRLRLAMFRQFAGGLFGAGRGGH